MFENFSGMEEKNENEGCIIIFCRDFSVSQSEKLLG